MNATKSKTIRVKTENVITTKDGRKWEIRKITEKYVLVTMGRFNLFIRTITRSKK